MAKTIRYCIVFVIVLFLAFAGGYFVGQSAGWSDNRGLVAKYEARLAGIRLVNQELQNANSRITEYNRRITERLSRAKVIIDGIDGQVEDDANTIRRLIESLSRLEQAIHVIYSAREN